MQTLDFNANIIDQLSNPNGAYLNLSTCPDKVTQQVVSAAARFIGIEEQQDPSSETPDTLRDLFRNANLLVIDGLDIHLGEEGDSWPTTDRFLPSMVAGKRNRDLLPHSHLVHPGWRDLGLNENPGLIDKDNFPVQVQNRKLYHHTVVYAPQAVVGPPIGITDGIYNKRLIIEARLAEIQALETGGLDPQIQGKVSQLKEHAKKLIEIIEDPEADFADPGNLRLLYRVQLLHSLLYNIQFGANRRDDGDRRSRFIVQVHQALTRSCIDTNFPSIKKDQTNGTTLVSMNHPGRLVVINNRRDHFRPVAGFAAATGENHYYMAIV